MGAFSLIVVINLLNSYPRNEIKTVAIMTSIEDIVPIRKAGQSTSNSDVEVVKFEDPEKRIRNERKRKREDSKTSAPIKPCKEFKSLKYSKQLTKDLNSMTF